MRTRKSLKTFLKAIAFSGIVSAAVCMQPVVFAADAADPPEEGTAGTVTVTVYDGDTGELFSADGVTVSLYSGKYQTKPKYGSFRSHGNWKPAEENPYTGTLTLLPQYNCFFELFNDGSVFDALPFYYEIDEARSVNAFNFNENTEQEAELYLVKHYRPGSSGGFWICRGTTADKEYPVLEQFYKADDLGTQNIRRRVVYQGKADTEFAYGDMFVTDDIVHPRNGVLAADVAWQKTGSCYDLPDIREMTVGFVDFTSAPFVIGLYDKNNNYFRYVLGESGIIPGISLLDAQDGDTVSFAIYDDISGDGMLTKEDAELLQKYLLSDPDAKPRDWKAADLDNDGVLTAADLSLLKHAYFVKLLNPHCTLTLTAKEEGYSIEGKRLQPRTSQETFTVYEGDYFSEGMARWFLNPQNYSGKHGSKIMSVGKITGDSVTIRIYRAGNDDEPEKYEEVVVPYGVTAGARSLMVVFDGYNTTYTMIFSDYSVNGVTVQIPGEKAPVISQGLGSLSAEECIALRKAIADKYPDTDFSDFRFRYDPEHPLSSFGRLCSAKIFSVSYKGTLLHGYGDCSEENSIYAAIIPYGDNGMGVVLNLLVDPEQLSGIDTEAECISAADIYDLHPYLRSSDYLAPERILYFNPMKSDQIVQAYRVRERSGDVEQILDAFTGEQIEIVSFLVPDA